MKTICKRLVKGQDLLLSIAKIAKEYDIKAGVLLSAVGCLDKARLRDADGVSIKCVNEQCEILSLMGTVSKVRTHLHLALSKQGLSAIGGHLVEGCIINTTCELIIGVIEKVEYGLIQDESTGYDEIEFKMIK